MKQPPGDPISRDRGKDPGDRTIEQNSEGHRTNLRRQHIIRFARHLARLAPPSTSCAVIRSPEVSGGVENRRCGDLHDDCRIDEFGYLDHRGDWLDRAEELAMDAPKR